MKELKVRTNITAGYPSPWSACMDSCEVDFQNERQQCLNLQSTQDQEKCRLAAIANDINCTSSCDFL